MICNLRNGHATYIWCLFMCLRLFSFCYLDELVLLYRQMLYFALFIFQLITFFVAKHLYVLLETYLCDWKGNINVWCFFYPKATIPMEIFHVEKIHWYGFIYSIFSHFVFCYPCLLTL